MGVKGLILGERVSDWSSGPLGLWLRGMLCSNMAGRNAQQIQTLNRYGFRA